jgi:hypothetical protein
LEVVLGWFASSSRTLRVVQSFSLGIALAVVGLYSVILLEVIFGYTLRFVGIYAAPDLPFDIVKEKSK